MKKISVIIPTFNEEQNLKELLPLVLWADEVLVIDSFSEDKSVDVAKNFNCKIIQHEYENSAAQKNRAINLTKNDWILIIDADERPTKDLLNEIHNILNTDELEADAFWIKRTNFFMGKKIKYSGWQNDSVIRLFNKNQCKYENKNVHAEIICNGKVGKLKYNLEHNTYKNIQHFLNKITRYSKWSAKDYFNKTRKVSLFHLLLKPLFRFVKHYFIKLGFLDGKEGFIISVIMAWGVFLRYVFILEKK